MITIPVALPHAAYLAYRGELDTAAQRVLASGWYIMGPEVEAFEKAFADHFDLAHAIGVANGTDAITVALRALDVGEGDVVLTVSHTAVATVVAIELTGATAVLIDIDPVHYTIDPQKVEDTLIALERQSGARPKAIVAVHLYGNLCDLGALRDICRRRNLFLIEDCAQAHGALFGSKRAGTLGDVATFSFYPTKNLGAFGDGGAVAFADEKLSERASALRQYGWRDRYISDIVGMNSRLDPLQAALLQVRLKHFESEIARRRAVAAIYDRSIAERVAIPHVRDGCTHAYHLYVVRDANRDGLRERLAAVGVGTAIHYPQPVHLQPAYASRIGIGAGGLSETERASREILSLPMHGLLSDEDAYRVVEAVVEAAR